MRADRLHARLMDNDLTKVQDDDYRKCLVDLPTELLAKILSYLSTPDKFKTRYVSRRFKDVSEMPLLWKNFVWLDYEPRHVCSVSKILKTHGEHVRRICFPAHVTPANILEMAHCCTKVTHLSLSRNTQLTLDHLEEIVHTMSHLDWLDVFTSGIKCDNHGHYEIIKRFLEVTVTGIKNLILRIDQLGNRGSIDQQLCSPVSVLLILEKLLEQGHMLPSVLNLFIHDDYLGISSSTLESWLASGFTLESFQIGLYDIRRVPMDLYPSVPLRKFQFGPTATPPLINLSDHGILDLDYKIFYVSDYDHYGEVKLSVSPKYNLHVEQDRHLHSISNFDSVSYVDFYRVNICPDHLKQLAIACPNLERLNLMNADNCLQSLQGLHAIVDTCQNLQGLNLIGIPVSLVESYLLLWELLSSIKKLSHLAIDMCMLIQSSNCDNADKEKLIGMLRSCDSLKALEMIRSWLCLSCENIPNVEDLLFSHFPSLAYVRLAHVQCTTALKYAITDCHQLKYLSYRTTYLHSEVHVTLPSSSSCHLQQLCLESSQYVDLSAPSVHTLSSHGKLKQVVLFVKSITASAITTLINNSPNLILLYIVTREPLYDEKGVRLYQQDYVDTVSKIFSYHKLLTTGNFILQGGHSLDRSDLLSHFSTDFKSLWRSTSLLQYNS